MKKLNNYGFTLLEILAVVVIIGILGLIAIPNVLKSINTGKEASYGILVKDVVVASKQLYEEIENIGSDLYHYSNNGKTGNLIKITNNEILVNLQTLVSNGLLKGINNSNRNESLNKNYKIITNPLNSEDIGSCEVTITKIVDENYNVSYMLKNNSDLNSNCPTTSEYSKVLDM